MTVYKFPNLGMGVYHKSLLGASNPRGREQFLGWPFQMIGASDMCYGLGFTS